MWSDIFHRRYFISLTYLLVVVIGIIAWRNIALETAPNLNLPSITVQYYWGSTSPEVMEKDVTRKVEEAANRLRNVQKIQSTSQTGQSSVTITFARHTPVKYRIVELRDYLSNLEQSLPANVQRGTITRQVPKALQSMQTFVVYSLSGNQPTHDLLEYARRNIKLPLLGLSGLADIKIDGARDPALTIEFNTGKMEKYGLKSQQILSEVNRRLQWHPAGYTQASGRRISILVPPQFHNVQSIRSMPVKLPHTQRRVPLSKLAQVSIQDYPAKRLRRINGSPALSIRFDKEAGADAIGLAQNIRTRMKKISQSLPPDLHIQLAHDATKKLRKQFGNLQYQAMISLLVVFLVLLLFIRRFRAPFVILGSILFSLLLSVSIMYFIGYTLNIITLAGLTVALGMIIDNAVVVFEQLNPGLPPDRAGRLAHIKQNLPHTLIPVFGSTLTTVGIFVPLFFAVRQLQIFLVPLAVALSLTLLSSVLIALSWIPYSLIWLVPTRAENGSSKAEAGKKGLFSYVRRPVLWLFSWRHRLRWVFYVTLILLIGIPLFAIKEPNWDQGTWWPKFTQVYFNNRSDIDPWIGGLSYRFFNNTYFGSPWQGPKQQRISITINPPQGTPMKQINKMARNFEKIATPYKSAFSFYETLVSKYNGARLTFYIKNKYLSKPAPYIFYARAQYLAARTGNAAISVNSGLGKGISTGFGGGSSNQRIRLTGYSYDQLLTLAKNLRRRLRQNRRVKNVDINQTGFFSRGNLYQYYLKLNDRQLALRGLNRRDLLNAISLDVNPTYTLGKINLNDHRMYLIGRNSRREFYPKSLMQKKRTTRDDSLMFDLQEVAKLDKRKVQSTIQRVNQAYERTVAVDFLGPYKLARSYIKKVISETPVPVGEKIQYGNNGFSFSNGQNTQNTLLLLGLTILSVWMIVSALLESWIDPLIVICAVPLSFIGVMA
ncbi:MAG TPA: efflux RND transporter permease subunit, partial [Balneolaceae bacterium]|nr:efflux RND transporter permease subunit [Balneolaceae bacterium]